MKQFIRNQCRRRYSRTRRPSTIKSREEVEVMRVEVRGLRNGKDNMLLTGTVKETEWDLDTKASFCPPFLVGKIPASMTFLEFQRANYQKVANQEKETF